MQRTMRIAWLAYVLFLTLLLLTANPARLIGVSGAVPGFLRTLMPWAHLLSFGVLAVLTLLARWPVPRWSVVLMLALYGGATEIIQGFVPPRTPEWADWFQDIGGVAVGVAIGSIVALLLVRVSRHAGRLIDSVPLLRRSSAERAPSSGTAWEQAVAHGRERWTMRRASLVRFFRVIAGV
jgi:VanZ family protein